MKIEFDETDYNELNTTISNLVKMKKRLIKSSPTLRLSNVQYTKEIERNTKLLDAIYEIFHTDISSIFENASSEPNFYVYAHCNPLLRINARKGAKHIFCATELQLKHIPFYIGKGIGDRYSQLNRNEGHRKIKQLIESANKSVGVVKIFEGLTEAEALACESKLIDILGLKQLNEYNFLINLDEGHKAEQRRALYKGNAKWFLNKTKMRLYNN